MTDFCPNCGYTLLGKKKDFCGNCGCAIKKRPKTTHMKTVGFRMPDGKIVDEPKIGYEAVQGARSNKPGSYSARSLVLYRVGFIFLILYLLVRHIHI